jgi:predicted transcriptional regulator
MARRPSQEPTERELEILRILWAKDTASLSEICQELRQGREVATTTVATVLKVMHRKQLVEPTTDRRWRPIVTQRSTSTSMLLKLINQVFDGSARRMMAQLLETRRLKPAEIAELRNLIDEHRLNESRNPKEPS